MTLALTHVVSPNIGECQLTYRKRVPVDYDRARAQHAAYCRALEFLGLTVEEIDVNADHPDSTFIEDTAVVVDEAAVLARMGTPSRRPEVEGIEPFLAKYRKLFRIKAPATLEGGDVLRMGRRIFAGLSPRTNSQGVSQLENFLKPFGYRVIPVRLKGCLHLKSACTPLDDRTLLANPGLLDLEPFQPVRVIPVDPDEPDAANVLRIGETLLMAEGYPKTRKILEKAGYSTHTVDISELIKAEAAITCSSILVTLHDRK